MLETFWARDRAVQWNLGGVRGSVWRDIKDVVEFLPDISSLGEGGVPGDPGEGECNEFLPAFRESFLKNRAEISKFFREKSSIPILLDIPRREGATCTPRPFGDETFLLGKPAKVCAHFLR